MNKYKVGDIVNNNNIPYLILEYPYRDECVIVRLIKEWLIYKPAAQKFTVYSSGVNKLEEYFDKVPNNALSRVMYPKGIEDGDYLKIKPVVNLQDG